MDVVYEPSSIKVGYKCSLIPGIIWQYVSVVCVSGVNVEVALGVLVVRGCSVPLFTCGGPLSAADNVLMGGFLTGWILLWLLPVLAG